MKTMKIPFKLTGLLSLVLSSTMSAQKTVSWGSGYTDTTSMTIALGQYGSIGLSFNDDSSWSTRADKDLTNFFSPDWETPLATNTLHAISIKDEPGDFRSDTITLDFTNYSGSPQNLVFFTGSLFNGDHGGTRVDGAIYDRSTLIIEDSRATVVGDRYGNAIFTPDNGDMLLQTANDILGNQGSFLWQLSDTTGTTDVGVYRVSNDGFQLAIGTVPEPSSAMLSFFSLIVLLQRRR